MEKIEFKNLPDETTPFNAETFNKMQDNIEKAIDLIKGKFGGIHGSKWYHLCDIDLNDQGKTAVIDVFTGDGQNGEGRQNIYFKIILKQGWVHGSLPIGITTNFIQNYSNKIKVKIKHLTITSCSLYIYLPFPYTDINYSISGSYYKVEEKNIVLDNEPETDKEATYYNISNSYSTDEQVVGTWIDGKPLYRISTLLKLL